MRYTPDFRIRDPEPDIKAIQINQYLHGRSSPLEGIGGTLKACEAKYNLNCLFVLAIAILESGWGNSYIARKKHNCTGWGAIDSDPFNGALKFKDFSECIETTVKGLFKHYVQLTIQEVNTKYCPTNPKWAGAICDIMNQLKRQIL